MTGWRGLMYKEFSKQIITAGQFWSHPPGSEMTSLPESGNLFWQIEKLLTEKQKPDTQSKASAKQKVKASSSPSTPKGRVLVINDDPRIGSQLAKWCAAKEYVVTIARNDDEANRLSKLTRFDAVIKSSEIITTKKSH
jgi:hypothetical protein